jgi:hypothetical protein
MATTASPAANQAASAQAKAAPKKALSPGVLLQIEQIRKDVRICITSLDGYKIPKSVKKRASRLPKDAQEILWEKVNTDSNTLFFRRMKELANANNSIQIGFNPSTLGLRLTQLELDKENAKKTAAVSLVMVHEMSRLQNTFSSLRVDKAGYSTHDKSSIAKQIHLSAQLLVEKAKKNKVQGAQLKDKTRV